MLPRSSWSRFITTTYEGRGRREGGREGGGGREEGGWRREEGGREGGWRRKGGGRREGGWRREGERSGEEYPAYQLHCYLSPITAKRGLKKLPTLIFHLPGLASGLGLSGSWVVAVLGQLASQVDRGGHGGQGGQVDGSFAQVGLGSRNPLGGQK